MITSALSEGFDGLYPLRVLVVAAVCRDLIIVGETPGEHEVRRRYREECIGHVTILRPVRRRC